MRKTIFIILALILLAAGWAGYFSVGAFVGTGIVSAQDWQKNWDLARAVDVKADPHTVGSNLIANSKKAALVKSLKIFYDSERIEREFDFETSGKGQLLASKETFIKFVTLPKLYDALLSIKYNSDSVRNIDSFNRAENILTSIENGQSFADLARVESDDKISGQLGGDLGFVSEGQILPELFDAAESSKIGEVSRRLVITRAGLHIIYPVETAEKDGVKLLHIKHILISTKGYDDWLGNHLSKIWVWRLK